MATPTGIIKASDINTELRRSSTANIRMGEADVRVLARVPSSTIRMSDLRSKSILQLNNQTVSQISLSSGFTQAITQIFFNSNGTISVAGGNNYDGTPSWSIITSSGLSTSGGGYEMRLFDSVVSGGSVSGPGGWSPSNEIMQDIGGGLGWTFTVTNPGSGANPAFGSFTADILIREKANVNVFVTASLLMTGQAQDLNRPLQ